MVLMFIFEPEPCPLPHIDQEGYKTGDSKSIYAIE